DRQGMADARLGLLRSAPPLAPAGPFDSVPNASPQLTAVSDLTNVVIWELVMPDAGIVWHAPLERLLAGQDPHGRYRVPPGTEGKDLYASELGEALLAPIVETVKGGIAWENYELIQEFESPDGSTHRALVRAVSVSDAGGSRLLGIVADISEPGDVPWVTADVAERLQLLVEHSPDGIIVHQDGLVVYTNPAAVRMVGLSSAADALGKPITSFISPDDLTATISRLAHLREPGDVVKGFELTLVRID